ncbi:hypothetical protein NHX12_014482, partial [Muraenolepis orangiensis]
MLGYALYKRFDGLHADGQDQDFRSVLDHSTVSSLMSVNRFVSYDSEYLVEVAHLKAEELRMIGDLLNENSLMYTALTEMIYEQADINDSTQYFDEGEECDLTKLSADAVLVTATAKATRFIDFDPLALSSVHYDSSTKIILTFSRRFWEDDDIKGGKSITDRPSRFIYYP